MNNCVTNADLEAHDTKYDDGRKDGGTAVSEGHDTGVSGDETRCTWRGGLEAPHAVVGDRIVRTVGYQAAKGEAEGEEDLSVELEMTMMTPSDLGAGLQPRLGVQQ